MNWMVPSLVHLRPAASQSNSCPDSNFFCTTPALPNVLQGYRGTSLIRNTHPPRITIGLEA